MVQAKIKHKPLPKTEPKAPRGKIIDIMDALRQSIAAQEKPSSRSHRKRAA
jgi:non-homologous end joining protein Ku